jgi:hypothetical protein
VVYQSGESKWWTKRRFKMVDQCSGAKSLTKGIGKGWCKIIDQRHSQGLGEGRIKDQGPYRKDYRRRRMERALPGRKGFARRKESARQAVSPIPPYSIHNRLGCCGNSSALLGAPPNKWRFVGSLRTTRRGLFGGEERETRTCSIRSWRAKSTTKRDGIWRSQK